MKRSVLNLSLPDEVVERLKNTVYWSSGWTLGEFIAAAVNKSITEIEAKRGSPFPTRDGHAMRKGPQSGLPKVQLSDLNDWIVKDQLVLTRQEQFKDIVKETLAAVMKQRGFEDMTVDVEKLLDRSDRPGVKRKNEVTSKETTYPRPV